MHSTPLDTAAVALRPLLGRRIGILAVADVAQNAKHVDRRVVVERHRVVIAALEWIDLRKAAVRELRREEIVDSAQDRALVPLIALARCSTRERKRISSVVGAVVDRRDPLPVGALGEVALTRSPRVLREVDVLRPAAVRRLKAQNDIGQAAAPNRSRTMPASSTPERRSRARTARVSSTTDAPMRALAPSPWNLSTCSCADRSRYANHSPRRRARASFAIRSRVNSGIESCAGR